MRALCAPVPRAPLRRARARSPSDGWHRRVPASRREAGNPGTGDSRFRHELPPPGRPAAQGRAPASPRSHPAARQSRVAARCRIRAGSARLAPPPRSPAKPPSAGAPGPGRGAARRGARPAPTLVGSRPASKASSRRLRMLAGARILIPGLPLRAAPLGHSLRSRCSDRAGSRALCPPAGARLEAAAAAARGTLIPRAASARGGRARTALPVLPERLRCPVPPPPLPSAPGQPTAKVWARETAARARLDGRGARAADVTSPPP